MVKKIKIPFIYTDEQYTHALWILDNKELHLLMVDEETYLQTIRSVKRGDNDERSCNSSCKTES